MRDAYLHSIGHDHNVQWSEESCRRSKPVGSGLSGRGLLQELTTAILPVSVRSDCENAACLSKARKRQGEQRAELVPAGLPC